MERVTLLPGLLVFIISLSGLLGANVPLSNGSLNGPRSISSRIYDEDSCTDGSYTGVCVDANECERRGGTSNENCWDGNVCCKITARCPSQTNPCLIRHSGTSVVNENTTVEYRRTYRFMKDENICQLRLDFDEFTLTQPDTRGDCTDDLMQVISSRTGLRLCGSNSNQHIYLDYDSRSYLDVSMRIRGNQSRYRIRSTFIECNSDNRAPLNCLQYFTDLEGSTASFNFGKQQLNNQEYSICVQAYEGISRIQWRPCRGTQNYFYISGGGLNVQPYSINCLKDWVQVYGNNRYCGRGFPTTTSAAKPFLLNVHFDAFEGYGVAVPLTPDECTGLPITDPYLGGTLTCTTENGICTCEFSPTGVGFDPNQDLDLLNTGFCLDYVQLP